MEGGDSRTAKGTSKATAWKREVVFGNGHIWHMKRIWAYLENE